MYVWPLGRYINIYIHIVSASIEYREERKNIKTNHRTMIALAVIPMGTVVNAAQGTLHNTYYIGTYHTILHGSLFGISNKIHIQNVVSLRSLAASN